MGVVARRLVPASTSCYVVVIPPTYGTGLCPNILRFWPQLFGGKQKNRDISLKDILAHKKFLLALN